MAGMSHLWSLPAASGLRHFLLCHSDFDHDMPHTAIPPACQHAAWRCIFGLPRDVTCFVFSDCCLHHQFVLLGVAGRCPHGAVPYQANALHEEGVWRLAGDEEIISELQVSHLDVRSLKYLHTWSSLVLKMTLYHVMSTSQPTPVKQPSPAELQTEHTPSTNTTRSTSHHLMAAIGPLAVPCQMC